MKLLPTCLLLILALSLSAQKYHIKEDFNNSSLPANWTNTAVIGTATWSFGLDGLNSSTSFGFGTQNIDGTPLAFFDDDQFGLSSNNTVELLTPSFDNSNDSLTYLEFDYNFKEFLGIADSFIVDVYDGSSWNRVLNVSQDDCGHYALSSNCGAGFPHANIDISSFRNANCQVRFTYKDGNDWAWYVGLDNVEIWSPLDYDVRVSSIYPPSISCSSNDSISVDISNVGTRAVSNFDVKFILNNGSPISANYPNSIAAGSTVKFTFPSAYAFPAGTNIISAYTQLVNDQNISNDSSSINYTVQNKFSLPYTEDFEGSSSNWTVGGLNSSWAIGPPNGTNISSAALGTNAAVTNLSGRYNASEYSYLESPCIHLGPQSATIRISFDLQYHLENGYDNAWLEYSIDGGLNWLKVNQDSIYRSTNWYIPNQYWTGSNQSWQRSSVVMRNLPANSTIKFRFVIDSDGSTQLEGVAVDNFLVYQISNIDLAVNRITYPISAGICGSNIEHVFIELENKGSSVISNALLRYQVNGGTIYTDTLNTSILGGHLLQYQFTQAYNFSSLNNIDILAWTDAVGDSILFNDSARQFYTNSTASSNNLPYSENFDSMIPGGLPSRGWTRNPANAFNTWNCANAASPSTGTGPPWDATGGNYWYLETSGSTPIEPTFTSPCINLSTNGTPALVFKYHKYGAGMDDLFIDINSGSTWVNIDVIAGQTHTVFNSPWLTRIVDLSAYRNKNVQIRFRGKVPVASFQGDMAIDDVRVLDISQTPLSLNQLEIENLNCRAQGNIPMNVTYNYYQSQLLDKDSVYFSIYENGVWQANEHPLQSIPGYSIDSTHIFSYAPSSNYRGPLTIKIVSTVIINNQVRHDSIEKTIINYVDQLPYHESFESMYEDCYRSVPVTFNIDNGWYADSSNNIWKVTNSDFQCGPYNINTFNPRPFDSISYLYGYFHRFPIGEYLYSPCFDLSNNNQAEVEFQFIRYLSTTTTQDTVGDLILEIDSAGSWIEIIRIDTITTGASASQSWIRSNVDISAFISNPLQFRFNIEYSNVSFSSIVGLDGFRVYDPLITDIEKSETIRLADFSIYPNPNNGQFTIELTEDMIGESYEILDLSGKTIKRANFKSQREELEINEQKGVYILRVPQYNVVEKIVVY